MLGITDLNGRLDRLESKLDKIVTATEAMAETLPLLLEALQNKDGDAAT